MCASSQSPSVISVTHVATRRANVRGMSPPVVLGRLADDSVAASVYVLVVHGAARKPELAAAIRGRVVLHFAENYAPVRLDFRGDEIIVSDEQPGPDVPCDLEIHGRLGDVNALVAAPLAGGLPKPTTPRGRAALARLADGRVDFIGPLTLARKVLMLLALDLPAPSRRQRRADARTPSS